MAQCLAFLLNNAFLNVPHLPHLINSHNLLIFLLVPQPLFTLTVTPLVPATIISN